MSVRLEGVDFTPANFAELRRLCLAYRRANALTQSAAAVRAGVHFGQWLRIEGQDAKDVGLGAIRKVVAVVLPTSDSFRTETRHGKALQEERSDRRAAAR